jgi:mono/diheme cytochrome c family protein
MQTSLRGLIVLSAALAAQPAAAQNGEPDKALIEAGAAVYQEKCAECHGERLLNTGAAFDLRKLHADERPRFDNSVTNGKGQMPAWGGILAPEQFDQLWAYIRSKAED